MRVELSLKYQTSEQKEAYISELAAAGIPSRGPASVWRGPSERG